MYARGVRPSVFLVPSPFVCWRVGVCDLATMRTLALPLALLLASGASAFVGSGSVGPSLKLTRRKSSDSPTRRFLGRNHHTERLLLYRTSGDDRECPWAEQEQEHQEVPVVRLATPSTCGSLAKRAVAMLALASFLTSAAAVVEVAVSPRMAGIGTGGGTLVAPAYAELEPLPLKSYSEEFSSGLAPVNTVRGLWRTRETRNDGSVLPQEGGRLGRKGICGGRLSFKGFVGAGKGTVEYKGCGEREGKGRWLTKPKNIVNGRITLSARWSIKFADGTSLLYRGDVVQDAEAKGTALTVDAGGAAAMGGPAFERPDAHIRGEVLRPVKSIQGTLTEKKIGEFEADLIELPSDEDKL